MIKYCKKCGTPLRDNYMICTKCGANNENKIGTTSLTINPRLLLLLFSSLFVMLSIFMTNIHLKNNYGESISVSILDLISGNAFDYSGDLSGIPDSAIPALVIGSLLYMILFAISLIKVILDFIQLLKQTNLDTKKYNKRLFVANILMLIAIVTSMAILNIDVWNAAHGRASFKLPIGITIIILLSIINIVFIKKNNNE